MDQKIDYTALMSRALRQVMVKVLEDVAVEGLPGDHHFFISFATAHPDVDMPDWLRAQHPEEMTIVIQNWYEDLVVSDDWFDITLSFSGQAVRLHVPMDAVLTFVDPSVEFGLRFEEAAPDTPDVVEDLASKIEESAEARDEDAPSPPKGESEVVRLDQFRK